MEQLDRVERRLPGGAPNAAGAAGESPGGASLQAQVVAPVAENFVISNVPTDVSSTEALDRSSAAYNPQRGEYFVVWHATTRATRNNIYGRFVSSAGSVLGAPFAIVETEAVELAPSVAYDATANQYWVAWTDLGSGGTGNIHLRRLSATGVPLGSDIVVNGAGPVAFAARIAWGAGRCVVVWASDPGDGNAHILLRAYDSEENALTPVMLLSDAVGVSSDPDVAFNPTDQNFLVAWSQQQTGTGLDVKSVGITADFFSFSPQTISAATGDQRVPRISFSTAAGRYLVVWYDGRSQQTFDIYGRLVGRDGVRVGSADIRIHAGAYSDVLPVVAGSSTASRFAVAYQTDISGATEFQIHASIVSGTGSVGSPFVVRQWYNVRYMPAIAPRPGADEYLVAFTDNGTDVQPDIQGQLANGAGALIGSLITVARGRKGQEAPRLAYDPAHGEYLTLWADYRTGSDYDLYARRVSAAGDLLGSEVLVGSTAALHGYPAVAYDATADEYLAVWQEVHSPSTGYEVYARRIGWAGDPRGSAILISRDTQTTNEGAPRVVYNPTADQYLVTWHAFTNGNWRIWAQRVSPTGALVASNFLVSASSGVTQNAHVALNGSRNEYLLVWQDLRNNRIDVYAQRLSATGGKLGGNFAISTAAGNKDGCDIAYGAAADDYLAVWGDARGGGNDVYAQRVDATGSLVGADFAIADSPGGETAPVVAYDAVTHGYLVAYWQFDSESDWDVWARFVPATGLPSDPSVAVSTATEVQNNVAVAQNPTSGEFLAVWQDFRAGSYNIYGQRLSNEPVVVTPTATSSRTSTRTATHTASQTATRTDPPPATQTATRTSTPPATPPATQTATRTGTPPATPPATQTATRTGTPPATQTATASHVMTPTATPTPGGSDCCQCESSCAAPIDGSCAGCTLIVGAVCRAGVLCERHTPTPTPEVTPTATATLGASDCCQCANFCAAPIVGTCGGCTVVYGASCEGGTLCVLRASPTPTASPTPGSCTGDCNGNGAVAIDELIKAVNVALGSAALDTCAAADRNGNGAVTIDELLGAVNAALAGC